MAKLVSRTYGDALFQLAVEENRIDTMFEEVRTVAVALQENPDLTRLMNHPKIDKEEKVKLIEDIFKGQVEDELVGLMRMIVEKDHYNEIESVFTYFMEQVIEKRLLETTKYVKFEMHYDVDAALIGGMVIRIKDRVVDSSIQTKLYDLTRELSKIQLKVGECAP